MQVDNIQQKRVTKVNSIIPPESDSDTESVIMPSSQPKNIINSSVESELQGIVDIESNDTVDCCCTGISTALDNVSCNQCHAWSHLVCYGYNSTTDSRLPSTFLCFKCDQELIPIADLKDLALKRKLLQMLESTTYSLKPLLEKAEIPEELHEHYLKWLFDGEYVKTIRLGRSKRSRYTSDVETKILEKFMDPTLNYSASMQRKKVSMVIKDFIVS
jgi:hypothetical protein